MERRTFLMLGGISAASLVSGSAAWRVGAVWWDQQTGDHWRVLSDREAQIAAAIADTMFPGDDRGMPSGAETDAVETLDEYLEAIPEQTANLLRLLLHAIDEMAVAADTRMTRFHRRPFDQRLDILNAWDGSSIEARREAFGALKLVLSMGYCESSRVLDAAGINYGCGSET